MNSLLKYFIDNSVATNLVMLFILIIGLLSLNESRIEAFPKVPASSITISTLFTGASSKQIDELITQKIEQKLEGIEGIKKVYSSSKESLSTVLIEKNFDTDIRVLKETIRDKLDEIYDFPQKMQRPIFSIDDFSMTAMYITLSGKTDIKTLTHFGTKSRESLLQLPEISKIDTWGNKSPQINISFNPKDLRRYNLSLDEIISILESTFSKEIDGKLEKDGKVISLSFNARIESLNELKNIPLFLNKNNQPVLLKDVASITNDFENNYIIPHFDDEIAYGMEVKITGHDNVIDIGEALKLEIAKINTTLPSNLKLIYWGDSSSYISNRLSLLNENAIQGILIVFILLSLFLNVKLAFWVAMGIPISIAGSIAILGRFDYSINDITTLGMILSLGLLVDDAIVIGESIFTQRKKTRDRKLASIKGVHRVATATIFGALTTIAAFIPIFLIQDELIKILASFSIVIIITLAVSIFESKFLLPSHIARIEDSSQDSKIWIVNFWNKIQSLAQNALRYVNLKLYAPILVKAIKHRYSVLILIISLAFVGIGMMLNGAVKTIFYPEIPQQSIQIKLKMDSMASSKLTILHAQHIEATLKTLNKKLLQEFKLTVNPVKHIFLQIEPLDIYAYIELSDSINREKAQTLYILERLKKDIGELEGADNLEFSATDSFAGKFAINIYSDNEEELKEASKLLMEYLKSLKGVSQVQGSLGNIISQLQIHLKPLAFELGFDEDHFSKQMSQYFSNTEVTKLLINNKETKVYIKQFDSHKANISDLLQIELKNKLGQWFPLSSIATIQSSSIPMSLNKENSKRVNTISASLDKSLITPTELQEDLWTGIMEDIHNSYPNVVFDEAGELESIGLAKKKLTTTLIITMLLIYVLLAIPLQSYVQPFIIMSIIPFAFIGSMFGHMFEGFELSIFSFLGILALIGIVVNDSLVMMTHYNQVRQEGLSIPLALRNSGVSRFRAIFLTTVTTVSGLMPLINESSENAQYLIPSAISIAYGEIFATVLTLILIPVLIAILEDIKSFTKKT